MGSRRNQNQNQDRYAFAERGPKGGKKERAVEMTDTDYMIADYMHRFNVDEGDGRFTAFGNVAHERAFDSEFGASGYDRFVAVNEEVYESNEWFDNLDQKDSYQKGVTVTPPTDGREILSGEGLWNSLYDGQSESTRTKWRQLMTNERNSRASKLKENIEFVEMVRRAEEKCWETDEDVENGNTAFDLAMSLDPNVKLDDFN